MRGFVIAAIAGAALLSAAEARAQGLGGGLAAPALVSEAACVSERIEGPRGVRVVRRCGPGIGMGGGPRMMGGCRTVQERIVGPYGGVRYRTVRRCG